MKCLIDGDSLVYQVGFASQKNIWQVCDGEGIVHFENESKPLCLGHIEDQAGALGVLEITRRIEVSPVEHAFHSLKVIIQKIALRAKANSYKIYLTGAGNFREGVATIMGYKHNRLDAEKPVLYQQIRDYLVEHQKATIVTGMEADDALSIVYARSVSGSPVNISADPNHEVLRHPDECIIAAIDKDLRNIPGKHINFDKRVAENDEYKFIVISEDEGRLTFWKQVLTGDSSDNILGIPGMGPKKADALLDPIRGKSEEDFFWAVYGAYKHHYGTEAFEYLRYDAYVDTTATFRKREAKPDAEILPEQRIAGSALIMLLENARLLWMLRVAPNAEGTHWWMPPLSFEAIAIEDEAQAWTNKGVAEEKAKQEAQGFNSTEIKTETEYADKDIDTPWSEGRGKWFVVTEQDSCKLLIGPLGTEKKVKAALADFKSSIAEKGEADIEGPAIVSGADTTCKDTQSEDQEDGTGNRSTDDIGDVEADSVAGEEPTTEDIDAVHYNLDKDNKWAFWGEDWTSRYGPYDTEEECRAALAIFVENLNAPKPEEAEVATDDKLVSEPGGPDFPDGTDAEGFPGGDERMAENANSSEEADSVVGGICTNGIWDQSF